MMAGSITIGHNIKIVHMRVQQGSTLAQRFEYSVSESDPTPINLTGFSARLSVRRKFSDPAPLLSLDSSPGGGLVITPLTGTIDLRIEADATSGLATGTFSYDCEIESAGGEVTTLFKGNFILEPEA